MVKEIEPEDLIMRAPSGTFTIKGPIDYEKILVYVGIISFLITFWQGWRDIHKDMADIKERVRALEVKVEKIEEKK